MCDIAKKWLNNNDLSYDIWSKKYQFENETFDEWIDRISNNNEELKNLILNKRFLFGGRILSNRGLQNKGKKVIPQNCFVIPSPEDNIESIYDTASKMARIFSMGGGVGIGMDKLAPKGAKINNSAETTTGAVSFMKTYDDVSEVIGQAGRRAALILTITDTHPDLIDFINSKTDLNNVTKANISVKITDGFMNAVINDLDWELFFERHTGEKITKIVKAKDVLRLISNNAWDNAEPGCLYWDTVQKYNMLSDNPYFMYENCNPCVTGDTKILTDKGYFEIQNLINKEINIWNGYNYSKVKPQITGVNQKILAVKFSNGSILKCTPYHKFILKNKNKIEAKDLKVGDKLIKCNFPVIDGEKKLRNAYTQGFFSGDGYICNDRNGKYISFYGNQKKDLIKYCSTISRREENEKRSTYSVDIDFDKNFVPIDNYNIKSKNEWLAGLIDSDGGNNVDGGINITSINYEFLNDVKFLLNTMGLDCTLSKSKNSETKLMPFGNSQKEYLCQDLYKITLSASDIVSLNKNGFNPYRVKNDCTPNRNAKRFIQISEIIEQDELESFVYCFEEKDNHSGIFNGVITSQCGELPMASGYSKNGHYIWGSACNLGSMNLTQYVIDNNFDFDLLYLDTKVAFKALNDVLFESIPFLPFEELKESVSDWRINGMGHMGLASILIKLGMAYGSNESCLFAEKIQKTILNASIEASTEEVSKYGTYKYYNKEYIENNVFFNTCVDESVRKKVLQIGLANAAFCTIAPTGTLSTMLNISGGGEPYFQINYTRTTKSLHDKDVEYEVYIDEAKKWLFENKGIENPTNKDCKFLPKHFICSQNINYIDRINLQSSLQKYNDGAISSTINLPENTTSNDVFNLYLYAWEKRLKGITIYRTGCSRDGILNSIKSPTTKKQGNLCNEDCPLQCKLQYDSIYPTSKDEFGETYGSNVKRKVACGNLYINLCRDVEGNIVETFINTSKGGICQSNINAISRLISTALRSGVKVEEIADTIANIKCPACTALKAKGENIESSCPDAIAKYLLEKYDQGNIVIKEQKNKPQRKKKIVTDENKCPNCGAQTRIEGGCVQCACGWSKCS